MILTPLLQVRKKNNIQRGKVTSLRRLSLSKGIHSYAGLMLLLMAFVGSLCSLTEAWWLWGKRTCFPCQSPIVGVVRGGFLQILRSLGTVIAPLDCPGSNWQKTQLTVGTSRARASFRHGCLEEFSWCRQDSMSCSLFPSLLASFQCPALSSWSQDSCQQHQACIRVSRQLLTEIETHFSQQFQQLSFLTLSLIGSYWDMQLFLSQLLWPRILIGPATESAVLRNSWHLSLGLVSSWSSLRIHQGPRRIP